MKAEVINTPVVGTVAPDGIKVSGLWPKVATRQSDWYLDEIDPEAVVAAIRDAGINADIFTFLQRPPDTTPRFHYPMEWDEMAVIRTDSFDDWWMNQIPKSTRKHVRRTAKRGVEVRLAEFNDELVYGIQALYNECPLRDGTPFSHYNKSFESLKASHETFLEQSDFIGAYLGDELIGFIKLTYAGQTARSMQILAAIKHRNKWPTNALIAKAVERCAEKNIPVLVYGQLYYDNAGSPGLTSFKKENGFVSMEVPRYYIPLNARGKLALKAGLHKGFKRFVPRSAINVYRRVRSRYYTRKLLPAI